MLSSLTPKRPRHDTTTRKIEDLSPVINGRFSNPEFALKSAVQVHIAIHSSPLSPSSHQSLGKRSAESQQEGEEGLERPPKRVDLDGASGDNEVVLLDVEEDEFSTLANKQSSWVGWRQSGGASNLLFSTPSNPPNRRLCAAGSPPSAAPTGPAQAVHQVKASDIQTTTSGDQGTSTSTSTSAPKMPPGLQCIQTSSNAKSGLEPGAWVNAQALQGT